jgi:hypothetical protein
MSAWTKKPVPRACSPTRLSEADWMTRLFLYYTFAFNQFDNPVNAGN